MNAIPFFIFSVFSGLYLAFMLTTGETIQANLKLQRVTRSTSPTGFRLYVGIIGVFCAGTFLVGLLELLGFEI